MKYVPPGASVQLPTSGAAATVACSPLADAFLFIRQFGTACVPSWPKSPGQVLITIDAFELIPDPDHE